MKLLFFSFILFFFVPAHSQVTDTAKWFEQYKNDLADADYIPDSLLGSLKGKVLPPFLARDLNGNTVTLETLRGKVVYLNFWFLSCAPCIAEIPNLNRLYENTKNLPGFAFYTITYEPEEQV